VPSRDATQALEDIVANIQRIESYIKGISFEEYSGDTRTMDAVERCLARISEAAMRLGDAAPGLCPNVPWADIRGIGNHLRHAYETIDQRIVWRVVTRELAPLQRACADALERRPASDGAGAAGPFAGGAPLHLTLASTSMRCGIGLCRHRSQTSGIAPQALELTMTEPAERPDWRTRGVRIVKAAELDFNTPQTPGMTRAAAIDFAKAGASKLWAGTVSVQPNAKTGAHHHGHLESIIYVVKGRARMRWGERLEYVAEADAGDFIYVPPFVPHQEINARTDEPLECVLVRSDQEPVVVNLEIEPAEPPEEVRWIDPNHPHG
jgi:uncharacterized RmlC-like cupin family protein/uncharacterized protein with HEPN domain